ncbi:hypothetical protein KCTC52924_03630 [Arenibacter antarcticus]|uniref:Uncharacterized protein n=1 Tax=Arenibacter antarcticus TaxID=2040469 RepID=A0ABW5VE60_9FLAO|nr:hypothetical protein [Arenibacter sp. H213]
MMYQLLAEGIATIATAFYPKDVIVRTTDFKTNEVPKSFRYGLLELYPKANDIEWEKNGNDYKVAIWFNMDGKQYGYRKR